MANAWAFSALWVGLAFIVKWPAMGFRAAVTVKVAAPHPGARRIIGVLSRIRALQISNERNQFLSSTDITTQPISKTRRYAIANSVIVVPFIDVMGFLQPAALGAGKAESSCLKLQNFKHLKSWTAVGIQHCPSP
jgi:hypothetical protein